MAGQRHVGVIDIGKTNAKVALVDLVEMREVGVLTTPNRVRKDGHSHYDTGRLWEFMLDGLAELERQAADRGLVVTTHGAAARCSMRPGSGDAGARL